MTDRTIIIPLISECQRFERWSSDLKPLHSVDSAPLITHARDSFLKNGQFNWVFIIRPDLIDELRPSLREWFPGAQFIIQNSGTLADTLLELINGPLINDQIYLSDADTSFVAPDFFKDHHSQGDAQILGTRFPLKARLGTILEGSRVASLTSHPGDVEHTTCGTFLISNKERFNQFLDTARNEDNAAEILKSWFHWGAKLHWHEADSLYSFISRQHILHYKGRYGSGFHSLMDFYPYYLSEHLQPGTRILHFIGTSIGIICFVLAILKLQFIFVIAGILSGYAFAWISHLLIEHNRPATFKYPIYSFACDFIMFWELLTGKQLFSSAK